MFELTDVKKSFSGMFAPILNGVSLRIEPGEFCVLIGANGSGKSTLMKVISGEHPVDAGRVTCDGGVAQVLQDVKLGTIASMTLLENLVISCVRKQRAAFSFYKRYKSDAIKKVEALGIGLEQYIDQPIGALSGGQRQMIATLMAVNSGSQILLLDEHTSALDPKMQAKLMENTANAVTEQHLTTLMITHNMEDAVKYGDRLIMLHKGRIALDIRGREKASLDARSLVSLFHEIEDSAMFTREEPCL
ncbi:MAG: ATP-binding cassette domain-containing protein [Holosporales bacterium]|jgi:putative ABC transport system ATP-binding protein|nr:ATP-binding cassette domain-containing protein [Holosporales bacterium]